MVQCLEGTKVSIGNSLQCDLYDVQASMSIPEGNPIFNHLKHVTIYGLVPVRSKQLGVGATYRMERKCFPLRLVM